MDFDNLESTKITKMQSDSQHLLIYAIYLSTCLPIYLSTYLPTYLPIYLSIHLSMHPMLTAFISKTWFSSTLLEPGGGEKKKRKPPPAPKKKTRNLRAASDMLRFIWTNWQIAPVKLLALTLSWWSCWMLFGYPRIHANNHRYKLELKPCLVHDLFLMPEPIPLSLQKWAKISAVNSNPPGVSSAWLVALKRALACVLLWIRRAFLLLRLLRQFCLTGALRQLRHGYCERLPNGATYQKCISIVGHETFGWICMVLSPAILGRLITASQKQGNPKKKKKQGLAKLKIS